MLDKRRVVWTKIHVNDPFPVAQTAVADIERLTMGAAMNLLVDIRSRDCSEIFILIYAQEFQHFIQSQTHHTFQQYVMGVRSILGHQCYSYLLDGKATY